jgi:hypothetical protein
MEGAMENWTNARLCDAANLILGAALFASAWMFGSDTGKAAENAALAGIAIVVLAVAALAAFAIWEEWLNLVIGLWRWFRLECWVSMEPRRCRSM